MATDDNPYLTPIADQVASTDPSLLRADSQPEGFPSPLTLAAIGFALVVGLVAALILAAVSLIGENAMIAGLAVPPVRLAWVIYTRVQTRRHQHTWSPGVRGLVLTVWILNVLLLCFDAILILFVATCFATIS
jgi:hypothetical protein